MAITEFSWDKSTNQTALRTEAQDRVKLSDDVLISNIRWFIAFRWVLIGALIIFAILVLLASSDTFVKLGISEQQNWPIAIIGILILANIFYIIALDYLPSSQYNSPTINLWIQIIVDLICLSIVVHYIGSTSTPISFFYVLHIALACIFFSARESLYVTILVCVMDTIVIIVDNFLFAQVSLSALINKHLSVENSSQANALLWMIFLDVLFLVVWYVVSRLSLIVRTHEYHLADAYKQIKRAQVEKDQYALLITHQLKSPLDAIRSKINLIKEGYLGDTSTEVTQALEQMDTRAKNMSGLILDLLRLERLKTNCCDTDQFQSINVNTIIKKCVDKLLPVINSKEITLNVAVSDFYYQCIPEQLEILFENIISNSIVYSHQGASIEVASHIAFDHASITVTDHGIGIESKDLPNIFNEYFYSPRAAMHNKSTSGIGLSIVKIAAENNKLKIKVDSEPGVGTTFTIIFSNVTSSAT